MKTPLSILLLLLTCWNLYAETHPWSQTPPAKLAPANVPQFVAITFDDNFGLASAKATGGMNYILDFYKGRKNPGGNGNPANFDGQPIHASFYQTSIYVIDDSAKALGGKPGEDHE